MIKNYIKIAWRNLVKNKFYLFLNLIGLTISMVFILLIMAYVWQANQVNATLRNIDRQYIIQSEYKDPALGLPLTTFGPLPKIVKEEYPQYISDYYRFDGITCIVSNEELTFEESAALGDASLIDMYGFEVLHGHNTGALADPFSVVLTEELAVKYFSKTDVVGETLAIRNFDGNTHDFKITAILKSVPENSVMQLIPSMHNQLFLPIQNQEFFGRNIDSWENRWIVGLVELKENVAVSQLEAPLKKLISQHVKKEIATNITAKLKPLKTYYLDDQNASIRKVIQALTITAIFLLIMAIVNFINVSMSQSFSRLKEIGVRKLMGISRIRLMMELLLEYFSIIAIASVLSLLLYPICKPLFSSIINKEIPAFSQLPFYLFIYYFIVAGIIGIISGIIPAVQLSKSHLINDIKGRFYGHQQNQVLKKSLLFFQFSTAVIVLMLSIVIDRQVYMFLNGDLGYSKDQLFTVQVPRDWSGNGLRHMETVRQELKTLTPIDDISLSYDVPGAIGNTFQKIRRPEYQKMIDVQLISSDHHFAHVYQIPLLAGSFFSNADENTNDIHRIVLSKKAAENLGFNDYESAIGQQIIMVQGGTPQTIAGVTGDFHPTSMHTETPAVLWFDVRNFNQYRYFSIKISTDNLHETLSSIEKKWKTLLPNTPFEIKFMDDQVNSMYHTEIQFKNASQLAGIISVIIVIISLISMTSIAVNQRMKEIGVRKVLGATIKDILYLFYREIFAVFALALLVAVPVAYFLSQQWLSNYAIKIGLDSPILLFPILGMAFLIVCILSFIIMRADQINPVKNLRDE